MWSLVIEGLIAITIIAVIGDMITKIAQAKIKAKAPEGSLPAAEVEALKGRIASLEARIEERDDNVRKLQDEVRFVSRMLEDKSRG
jgi:HAMP domain-containing protein